MDNDIITNLRPLFYPNAVAVIGASNREGNFGRMFTQGFIEMGFEKLYVVHPKEQEVLGIKAYKRISDIQDDIDLAVVVSPLDTVIHVVKECADKGVKGVVIFTSGFREIGGEGRALEQKLVDIARQSDIRIIGPNCMGIYCPESKSTISSGLPKESGPVSMISHSGSLAVMLTLGAVQYGVRFSKVVSCGNECDLNVVDFLEYFGQDHDTTIITGYLESIKCGHTFSNLARKISKKKPIIIWKSGITERGARAAASHTGAIAVSSNIWNAAVTQAGIISAHSAEDLLDYIQAFYYLPLPKGKRVAIISGPGGPAVGTSDACIYAGLELAELSPQTKKKISEVIPSVGTSIDNPIDLGMASGMFPQWYTHSIEVLGKDDGVDMLLIIGGSREPGFHEKVMQLVKQMGKPAAMTVMPGRGPSAAQFTPSHGLAIYSDGRRAAMALGKLAGYAQYREQ